MRCFSPATAGLSRAIWQPLTVRCLSSDKYELKVWYWDMSGRTHMCLKNETGPRIDVPKMSS